MLKSVLFFMTFLGSLSLFAGPVILENNLKCGNTKKEKEFEETTWLQLANVSLTSPIRDVSSILCAGIKEDKQGLSLQYISFKTDKGLSFFSAKNLKAKMQTLVSNTDGKISMVRKRNLVGMKLTAIQKNKATTTYTFNLRFLRNMRGTFSMAKDDYRHFDLIVETPHAHDDMDLRYGKKGFDGVALNIGWNLNVSSIGLLDGKRSIYSISSSKLKKAKSL